MQRPRHRQHELGNRRLELGAVLCGHLVAALHRADRRRQVAAAGVFELLARVQQRLVADHGQPTHVFDLDKLEGGIVVRRARKGERLKTLDGVERVLDPEDLVVADHAKPVGLAGVMGGWETMITPATTNVLVEAAWFDPMAVRQTARRHGLHTDASHRFERGADFNAAPVRLAPLRLRPVKLAPANEPLATVAPLAQACGTTLMALSMPLVRQAKYLEFTNVAACACGATRPKASTASATLPFRAVRTFNMIPPNWASYDFLSLVTTYAMLLPAGPG